MLSLLSCLLSLPCVITKQHLIVLSQIDRVQDALEFGFCGSCPTEAPSWAPSVLPTAQPSSNPTASPTAPPSMPPTTATPTMVPTTAQPTMSPTGFLDGCDVEPPSCSVEPDDGEDRVTFCLVIVGLESEECVLIENVRVLLDLGKCVRNPFVETNPDCAFDQPKAHCPFCNSHSPVLVSRSWLLWTMPCASKPSAIHHAIKPTNTDPILCSEHNDT